MKSKAEEKWDCIHREALLEEIDRRISLLEAHKGDQILATGNPYQELNQALSKIIGVPLVKELASIREYIQSL